MTTIQSKLSSSHCHLSTRCGDTLLLLPSDSINMAEGPGTCTCQLIHGGSRVSYDLAQLHGLTYLPLESVKKGMQHLKDIMSEEGASLREYFNQNYVSGVYRTSTVQALSGPSGGGSSSPSYRIVFRTSARITMMTKRQLHSCCEGSDATSQPQ